MKPLFAALLIFGLFGRVTFAEEMARVDFCEVGLNKERYYGKHINVRAEFMIDIHGGYYLVAPQNACVATMVLTIPDSFWKTDSGANLAEAIKSYGRTRIEFTAAGILAKLGSSKDNSLPPVLRLESVADITLTPQ